MRAGNVTDVSVVFLYALSVLCLILLFWIGYRLALDKDRLIKRRDEFAFLYEYIWNKEVKRSGCGALGILFHLYHSFPVLLFLWAAYRYHLLLIFFKKESVPVYRRISRSNQDMKSRCIADSSYVSHRQRSTWWQSLQLQYVCRSLLVPLCTEIFFYYHWMLWLLSLLSVCAPICQSPLRREAGL